MVNLSTLLQILALVAGNIYLGKSDTEMLTQLPKKEDWLFNLNRKGLRANNSADKLHAPPTAAVDAITEKAFVKSREISSEYNDSNIPNLGDALKNIAYYLRAHKFNEYDRRYEKNSSLASKKYFTGFPQPPVRSLHWEVHKYCEQSFLSCVEYLNRNIKQSGLKRADDTAVVIEEQKWNYSQHPKQIDAVESECRKMLEVDDIVANPFQGPIERFQWRTTASYYMCWFTMKELSPLKHLSDNCDNFANCLDPIFGVHNHDLRADDSIDFSCAQYSFCPDPCCPIKYAKNLRDCWENKDNPCFAENIYYERDCVLNRSQNTNLRDIILNRWNVSCTCSREGFEWDSKYGMCIDTDECLDELHGCDPEGEACVNLPGSFRCVCRWGYRWNLKNKHCEPITSIKIIEIHKTKEESGIINRKASSIVKRIFNKLSLRNGCMYKTQSRLFFCFFVSIVIYTVD